METKEAYEQKIRAQLAQWDAELDKLRAKVLEAEADATLEYQVQIQNLERHKDDIANKLLELKQSSEEGWQDIQIGLEKAYISMEEAFKSAFSKFKS